MSVSYHQIWTYEVPPRNSAIIASRSFCTISPCIDETVKLDARIFSVNQSTCRMELTGSIEFPNEKTDLSPGITEDDGLGDGKSIVQVTQCIELPIFLLHGDKELFDTF